MQIDVYDYRQSTMPKVDSVPMTDELVEKIARWNGELTSEQVRQYLELGSRVYTNLHFYTKAEETPQ